MVHENGPALGPVAFQETPCFYRGWQGTKNVQIHPAQILAVFGRLGWTDVQFLQFFPNRTVNEIVGGQSRKGFDRFPAGHKSLEYSDRTHVSGHNRDFSRTVSG